MVRPLISIASSDPDRLDLAERLHAPMLERTSLFLRSGISTSPRDSTNSANSAKTSITNQPELACFSSAYGWHSICIQNRIRTGTCLSAGGVANDLQIRDSYKGRILERTSVKVDLRKERGSHWPFVPTDYYPTGSYGQD